MNRRLAGSLLIVVLVFLFSFYNYRANNIRAPIDTAVKAVVQEKEASVDSIRETGSAESQSALHNKREEQGTGDTRQGDLKQGTSISQAAEEKVQTEAKPAAIKPTAKAVTSSAVNPPPPIIKETINKEMPVSRSDFTDKYTYPKLSKSKGIYGQFHYRDTSGGRIEIDPGWLANNIVSITLPGLNRQVQVHKEAADNFIQAFNYIVNGSVMINGKRVPLLNLIRSMDGTFVSRHVNWNPENGLSNHSWGTAIDINAGDHFRRVDPEQEPNDPNLILWEKAFKPAGFSWGNSYADAMHYELLP